MQLIYCAAGNKKYAEIAIKHGFSYGARLPHRVYFPPVFVDQEWKQPNRAKYMAALATHKPYMASVLDWEEHIPRDEVFSWALEAAQHVTHEVIIIPKVIGSVASIPHEIGGKKVRLGYSVPTEFAGTKVPPSEFTAWGNTHLLGGSPDDQLQKSREIPTAISADGNFIQKMANRCQFYACNSAVGSAKNRTFPQLSEVGLHITQDAPYAAFDLSVMNLKAAWLQSPAYIRYSTGTDEEIAAVKSIANKYSRELGYVMVPKLREAAARRELLVAVHKTRIVGFVNYHARRDGWQTVYELAVHPEWRGMNVGRALLSAVPTPVRLKCTVDNSANKFYEAVGFQHNGREAGRKRPLNVWISK
jgi:GNAT superfamily N-acetyltransferase